MASVALVIAVSAVCIASIPNAYSTIDEVATLESCTSPIFPELISRSALGWIRVAFAVFICIVTGVRIMEDEGMACNYLKESKLKRGLMIDLSGYRGQLMFTSLSWNLLGLSFAFSGLLTLFVDNMSGQYSVAEITEFPYMKLALRTSLLLFETVAPLTMLVSVVVAYALWPNCLRNGGSTDGFKRKPVLLQHNANTIMSLTEVGLLGGLPVRYSDMALAPLFGIAYIIFSWGMRFRWVPSGEPQFVYFFLDTTLGRTSTIALLVLVVILTLFYVFFVCIDDLLLVLGGGKITHFGVVATLSMMVCRFRD